jgi:hypothetical protein
VSQNNTEHCIHNRENIPYQVSKPSKLRIITKHHKITDNLAEIVTGNVIQLEMRRIIFPFEACLAPTYFFPHISHKWHDVRKKDNIEHKMYVLILSTNLTFC